MPTPNADKPYPQMVRDLKGLKIGISSAGASTDTMLQYLLREAGLDPKKDVNIVPVGDPDTMLAALKNGVIDGAMAVEPAQTVALHGIKIAKMVVDVEGGGAPLFKEYAYNGMFVRAGLPQGSPAGRARHRRRRRRGRAGDQRSGPHRRDHAGRRHLHQRASIRRCCAPISSATARSSGRSRPEQAMENVNKLLLAGNLIAQTVPYDRIVATDFMPRDSRASLAHETASS